MVVGGSAGGAIAVSSAWVKCRSFEPPQALNYRLLGEGEIMSIGNPKNARSHDEHIRESQPDSHPVGPPRCAITATAQLRIQMAHYPSLRSITCEYRDGILVLEGRVTSFHHKQLAQELVRNIAGVELISNRIKVAP